MMLEIILTSSVLILIIMLLRALCRKSIKPTLRYALWLIVALRLVLPFSLFSSNASVMNFFGRAGMVDSPAPIADNSLSEPSDIVNDTPELNYSVDDYTPASPSVNEPSPPAGEDYISPTDSADPANQESQMGYVNPTYPDSDIALPAQDNFPQQNVPEPAEAPETSLKPTENQNTQPQTTLDTPSADNKQPSVSVSLSISLFGRSFEFQPWLVNAVKAIWFTVAIAMGIWFFGVNIAFGISLRRNRRELDLDAPIKVYAAKNISSPCLFGLFRSAVYVNEKAAENEASLRFVIAHEYCHYRHGDMFWSLLRCVLLSVYWFNPLVWAAAYLSKRDCECSCDEAAIKLLGEPLRLDYGKALVSMIPERRADLRLIGVASTSMSGSKRAVRERVKLIAKKPKNAAIAVVLVIAVLIAAVGCTFTSADNDKEKDLPDTDIADTENLPENPDNADDSEDVAKPDDSENDTGMRIEKYDLSELGKIGWEDTKPFILPINTEHGVEDCQVHVKVDGGKLVGVFSFNPIGYGGLSVIKSGDDYCYFYDGKSEQIYYYNVTTGETTALLSNSYDGHTKQEFIDYFKQLNDKETDSTKRKMWLNSMNVSSDGKWLSYFGSKWTIDGKISAKNNIWLHNIETGEELIANDLLSDIINDAVFERLLPDDRFLAVRSEPVGLVYYIVNIITKEKTRILSAPNGAYSEVLSDKYILVFDGDAHVYDITNSEFHEFLMAIDNYDFTSLYRTECKGDCLAIAPNEDVAYVIDLARDKKEKFTPPDERYGIRVQDVYDDTVVFNVSHKRSNDSYGNFVVKLETQPEADTPTTELKLYSRHVEYSSEKLQKFVPEVYDMTPIYEILGEEAAQKALAEHYKREMLVRQSVPPLYRLIKDTGITREQLEAYNETAENKLSDEVIEALYYPYDTMASKALIGRLAVFYNGKAYSLSEAVYHMSRNLPGALSDEFREDISEYWMVWDGGGSTYDIESANKVVKQYVELLNSGEPPEDYPASVTDYYSYCIGERSYISDPNAINVEIWDPSTERGAARWQEIISQNAYSTYYLPINLENKTVDCEIKTVTAGTGKIADISYKLLAEGLTVFGESSESCFILDPYAHKIYRFDIATAECTPIISTVENGSFIEAPEHYVQQIHGGGSGARYPLQVSPDGKWLLYRSDKWLKNNVLPKDKYHTWLHNLETGEELLFDDVAIYATGYEKQFEYLLADNKILVSGNDTDGSTCYSLVDITTKKSEKLLTVPANVVTFAASRDYICYSESPKNENQKAVMAVYDITDGSIHRFRFDNSPMTPRLLKCLGKCLVIENYDGGVMVMNLECDTAVSLRAPDSIENGVLGWNLISDRLVLIEEYSTYPYNLCANIAVWTGLERQARGTSLAQRLYGRHVEYTAPEYQKFIPEVYDLTPIYEILGEEKASAAVAEYYSLICEERQALPPLYRLVHDTGITREQLKKYNETAKNKLNDDVIEALYLDSTLDSASVKQALLAETSLFHDGNAYSLWEALSGNLPVDVMVEYLDSIEGYVQRNCSNKWITHVANAKDSCAKAAKNPKIGDAIYSFNMIASQGKQATTYRIDVVLTGKDRHNAPSEDDPTIWGEFELRAFDKSGKQTGSVKLYSDVVSQYGYIGLDAQGISGSFITEAADNIIVFSMPNGNVNDNVRDAVIYGITISGELFMYEIEDSEDFRYISPNPGGGSMSRVSANTVLISDLDGRFRPGFEGDTDNTKYLCDFYSDDYFRTISFYRVDEKNRKIIPHIFIDGSYGKGLLDSVISELKFAASRALHVKISESEAYVYYLVGEGTASFKDSGVFYTKAVMDENGKWHAEGETMRVKTQADIAGWFKPSDGNAG